MLPGINEWVAMAIRFPRRILSYTQAAWRILSYALLGVTYWFIINQFAAVMLPRFAHIGASGVRMNDRPCGRPECDFSMFWPGGLLARAHNYAQLYQPGGFLLWRQHVLNPLASRIDWIYPPPTLLPSMAISYLPFEWAFIVWSVGFALAAVALLRWARLPWSVIGLTLCCPAALWNFEMGQLGLIEAAALVAGILMLNSSRLKAGFCLGLLIFKPQAVLLVPAAMLATRNWKAITGAAIVTLAAIIAVTIILGWPVWIESFSLGRSSAKSILEAKFFIGYQQFGVSVFWMMRSLGAALPAAYAVQAIASAVAVVLAWRLWRIELPAITRMSLMVFLSLLVTPYGFIYDMVGYSIALAALAQQRGWRIGMLDALFWLWPALCPIVTMQTGILFTPVIIILAIIQTWLQSSAAAHSLPAPTAVLPRAA